MGSSTVQRFRVLSLAGLAMLSLTCPVFCQGKGGKAAPRWIWMGEKATPNQDVFFRKTFALTHPVAKATLHATCDNQMTVYLNGKEVASSDTWEAPVSIDVTKIVQAGEKGSPGKNVLAVKAHNTSGPAGLVLRLTAEAPEKKSTVIVTDASWTASPKGGTGWETSETADDSWVKATVIAPLGKGPWAAVSAAAFAGGGNGKFRKPSATPIELIKAKKDFKVELLYTVPRDKQGSWVSLCTDDKGRLITSDQYGKLYRITPPALNGKADDTKVEELPVDLGEAQGLLWAFDSLYVVVNRGKKYPSGLYRVTSSKKNDVLDTKELLRPLSGGGEHGPHAVILSPDRKSLYIVAGNHTNPTELASSKVPQVWGEDSLVPRLWDASGHAVGRMAPAGCIYRVDPSGKNWELISIGYRNEYDIGFNREGELFTYDSDMEWDMNLPWYRPTRVCHAVPGSEFGWRGGTGKMYEYHPDNLPPVVNVGPGSPTGIAFGYGAKFPAKYQDALFICDWSYGKLYAVHMKPDGASYTGELEEFIVGSPLPLTDVVINPKDGAMYFTIGGRTTLSGLYRVTYTGSESTSPVKAVDDAGAKARAERRMLESFYGKKDAKAIEAAWPFLSSEDRFLRFAARTVLEFQDPKTWQDKALAETDPVALTHALIGLARVGAKKDATLLPRILEALERADWSKLSPSQKVDYLRAYQLAFIRQGDADTAWKERAGKRLNGFYPASTREVNAELSKLICYLEPAGGIAKTLALLKNAPTQEEQIELALGLRMVKSGWTLKEREEYFNWFHKGAGYRGGNSFHKFLNNIRNDAVKTLSPEEKSALKPLLAKVPVPTTPKFSTKERSLVKRWGVDELLPAVEKQLTARDFDKGRNLFGEAKCFACHRFGNEGGGLGPDLTALSGRFGPRDLLDSLIHPSKVISDQYQGVVINTLDGKQIMGRIVNLNGDGMMINVDMLDPNKLVNVNRNNIDTLEPAKVSMMPENLLDTFTRDEILDLLAYLYSRGDRNHAMFKRKE